MKKLLCLVLLVSCTGLNAIIHTWLRGKKGETIKESDLPLPQYRGFLGELIAINPTSTTGKGALLQHGQTAEGETIYEFVEIIGEKQEGKDEPTIKIDNGSEKKDISIFWPVVLNDKNGKWRENAIQIIG